MADVADGRGVGYPEWTSLEKKRGLDPLGMQTTSVALYQQLVPGISNVTLRVRYYVSRGPSQPPKEPVFLSQNSVLNS